MADLPLIIWASDGSNASQKGRFFRGLDTHDHDNIRARLKARSTRLRVVIISIMPAISLGAT